METIKLYNFQIDFIKELLRDYQKSKHSDLDTRLLAKDIDEMLTSQVPDVLYTTNILTGELIAIAIEP